MLLFQQARSLTSGLPRFHLVLCEPMTRAAAEAAPSKVTSKSEDAEAVAVEKDSQAATAAATEVSIGIEEVKASTTAASLLNDNAVRWSRSFLAYAASQLERQLANDAEWEEGFQERFGKV